MIMGEMVSIHIALLASPGSVWPLVTCAHVLLIGMSMDWACGNHGDIVGDPLWSLHYFSQRKTHRAFSCMQKTQMI